MNAICQKCRKRKTCTEPCAPVEMYINQDGRLDHEKKFNGNSLMLYHRKREKPISTILSNFNIDLDRIKIDEIMSDENRFPFSEFSPELLQTKIFLLRLYGISNQEIADYFNMKSHDVRNIFNACKDRFLIALKLMDDRKKICSHATAIVSRQEEKTGKIPSMKKQFLLSKLFDLTPREIGKILKIRTSTVMGNLKLFSEKNQNYFE